MLRMEIAMFLVLAFVAYVFFSAEKKHSELHRTFSVLLIVALIVAIVGWNIRCIMRTNPAEIIAKE